MRPYATWNAPFTLQLRVPAASFKVMATTLTSLRYAAPCSLGFSLALVAVGCVSREAATGVAHADRLKQVYPELQSGRFLVIADFEEPTQLGIVELVNASGRGDLFPHTARGRAETGGGALLFASGSAEDTLVLANRQGSEWYLKRDWRAYDVMLISIQSPTAGLTATVTIAGGQRLAASTTSPLNSGWNTVRLDLAELGEQVPLDDVQEIRLSISGQSKPVTVVLDDFLLTGSREELFGDSGNTAGALYVQRVGKRWNIGAGGRFEITLMNGQIRRWYNLAADPHRIRNLVEGTALGPMPMAVDSSGNFAALTAPGANVTVQQRIIEMNPVRAVVEVTWHTSATDDSVAIYRWNYTIYPTGQVFARVELLAAKDSHWSAPLGAVVSIASGQSDIRTRVGKDEVAHSSWLPDDHRSATVPMTDGPRSTCVRFAEARHVAGRSKLVAVPFPGSPGQPNSGSGEGTALLNPASPGCNGKDILVHTDESQRLTWFVLWGNPPSGPLASWTAQLILTDDSAPDDASNDVPQMRAIDYAAPAPIEIQIGSPISANRAGAASASRDAVTRADGYDAASGAYLIQPNDDRVRLVVDGRRRPLFSPAFVISGSANKEAWVYVDHLIFSDAARDANGDVVFQVREPVRKRMIIETILRDRPNPSTN